MPGGPVGGDLAVPASPGGVYAHGLTTWPGQGGYDPCREHDPAGRRCL